MLTHHSRSQKHPVVFSQLLHSQTAVDTVNRNPRTCPSTLRNIAQWKYLVSDWTSAFNQIALSRHSLRYCGVVTLIESVHVYTHCAMGMPGYEITLEELMCCVLGHLVQEDIICKLADDLFCGGNSLQELLHN